MDKFTPAKPISREEIIQEKMLAEHIEAIREYMRSAGFGVCTITMDEYRFERVLSTNPPPKTIM